MIFLDTTLRDGEQAANYALPLPARVFLAEKLAEAGVDIIEAGFPLSSVPERKSCREIAAVLADTPAVLSLMTRGKPEEIRETASLFKKADSLLHLTFPVSFEHIESKFKVSPQTLLNEVREIVSFSAGFTPLVECGAEDATRANVDFLCDYCETAIQAGAKIINIADTLGVAAGEEIAVLIETLRRRVRSFADGSVRLSIHCHNDRGLALANTLTAIRCGATQIESTLCGLGERAGNAPSEVILANLRAHPQIYQGKSKIDLVRLLECAMQLSRFASSPPEAGHPLLGNRTCAHASGIHQDGIRKSRLTYTQSELPLPVPERIVLSRHSGKSGIMLVAESCRLPMTPGLAAQILEELKIRSQTALGFTEFLRLYFRFSGTGPLPDHLYDIRNVYAIFEIGHFRLTIVTTNGELICGKGADLLAAAFDAVNHLTKYQLMSRRIEIRMLDNHYRCYAEVAANGEEPFPAEHTGADPAVLLTRCLFDAINFYLIKEQYL